MKKHIMLGVDPIQQRCCILESLVPFSALNPTEIEQSDFHYHSTNWGGSDSICRTLETKHLTLTGNILILPVPITYSGSDSDMGHSYSFQFEFTEIHETREP